MRKISERTIERTQFIKDNPHLTLNEMAERLGISRAIVEGHVYYHDLPFKSAIKSAGKRNENSFFNVHSHMDWLVG